MSSTYSPASFASTSFDPDRLLAGGEEIRGVKATLLSGQNLTRGALVGKITASGKYTLSLAASADGSEVPDAILAQDCDASAADTECLVYLRGDFNANSVTFGTGHTATSTAAALRLKDITLVAAQSA